MAKKVKELQFTTPNKVGVLACITDAFKTAKINIQDIWAYVDGSKAYFGIITNKNAAAKRVLKKCGMRVKEKDLLVLNLQNKVGVLARISRRLAKGKVNITCLSATTSGKRASVLVNTNNNRKAMRLV